MNNKIKNFTIRIPVKNVPIETALSLRYLLADTIEKRGLAQVWNEGTGEGYMEINFDWEPSPKKEKGIKSVLTALGIADKVELIFYD